MRRCLASLFVALAHSPALAAGLNDTGQSLCYDTAGNTVGCNVGGYPRQDGRYGRDAANAAALLAKSGAGASGFDYTRICNSGHIAGQIGCPASPAVGRGFNEWGCTRDNQTGLVWEVKTDDNSLRDKDWTYSWHNPDAGSNGGNAGLADGGVGQNGDNCFGAANCDTGKFIADVNAMNSGIGLCGHNDWRLPGLREIHSITHKGTSVPSIDAAFFPNTLPASYWTASTYAPSPAAAWIVDFGSGGFGNANKTENKSIRLVRGRQFPNGTTLPEAVDDAYQLPSDTASVIAAPGGLLVNDTLNGAALGSHSTPAHGALTLGADGGFTYTPDAAYVGADSFTYTLTNANGTSTATTRLTVVAPPTATADSYQIAIDTRRSVAAPGLLANDAANGGTAILTTPASHGSATVAEDGGFSYAPANGYAGSDSFAYTVTNAAGASTATVTLTLVAAPLAAGDAYSVALNTPRTLAAAQGVLANDTVNGATIVANTAPAHGTLSLNSPDGSFTYTPGNGYAGADAFTYTLTNVAGSSTGNVSLTTYVPPVATTDSYSVPSGSALNPDALAGVLANDTGGSSVTLVAGPSHGTLTLNADGSFSYVPSGGYSGTDSFTYTISNYAGTSTGTVNLSVTAPPAITSANTVNFYTGEAASFTVTTTGAPPPGVTVSGSLPASVSFSSASKQLSGTALLAEAGNYPLTVTADNGVGSPASQSFTLRIVPVNQAPSFTKGANQTIPEDAGPQTVAAWATAISVGPASDTGQSISFETAVDAPALFAAGPSVAANGTLSFTPAANACGTANVGVTARDDGGTAHGGVDVSAQQSFQIVVTCVNDAPSFTAGGNVTVAEDSGTYSTAWASAVSRGGGSDEASQVLTFQVSNDNTALFTQQPAITSAGVLTFTPAGNANGIATATVSLKDDGGTANGGVDTSASSTFTITVTPVNDPPVATDQSYAAQAHMPITIPAASGLLQGASDTTDGGTPVYIGKINGLAVSAGSPTVAVSGVGTVTVTPSTGAFDFQPAPGITGNKTFTFDVCDSGTPTPDACITKTAGFSIAGPVIWFVDPGFGAGGDGTLNKPFTTLAEAVTQLGSNTNQRIFLYSGYTYPGGRSQNAGEWLVGQGTTGTFDAVMGITPPANTWTRPTLGLAKPTVSGTVTLGNGSAVKGLLISAGANTGLNDSGTAVANVAVSQVDIVTTTGTAIDISDVSSSTFALGSVSANGGASGIKVRNFTNGSFTVSGGTIQNLIGADAYPPNGTGVGIWLSGASGVALSGMTLNNFANFAIYGSNVANFSMSGVTVGGTNGSTLASPYDEASVSFDNLSGTASITGSTIGGGFNRHFRLVNTTGTLDRLTLDNVTFPLNGSLPGDDAVLIEAQGTAIVKVTVQNSSFNSAAGDLFQMNMVDNSNGDLVFSGNTLNNQHPAIMPGGGGINIVGGSGSGNGATLTYSIANNTLNGAKGTALLVRKGSDQSGAFSGTVSGNTLGSGSSGSLQAPGIAIHQSGGGSHRARVHGNNIQRFGNQGLYLVAGENLAGTSGAFDVTATGNVLATPTPYAGAPYNGLYVNAGTIVGDAFTVCADIGGAGLGNSTAGSGTGGENDIRVRQRMGGTLRLPGYGGAAGDTAAVQTYLSARNTGTVVATTSTSAFAGGAACLLP